MNEQFKALALQAGLEQKRWTTTDEFHTFLNTFANLIVRKCINIVDILPNGYKDYRNAIENEFREDCINTMKKHFGVEQ